jgi:hypothetical protein
MKIAKMAKLDGASKYGSCMDCSKSIRSDPSSLKITLESGASVILCEKCWKKLTHILDEIDFNDVLKILKKQEDADE